MIAVGVGPPLRMAVVASPDYLAAHPAPQTPQEVTPHRCVNQRMLASGQTYDWEFEQDGRALDIKVTGPLTYNEPALMLEAALDGLGLAYILEDQADAYLAAGRLIRLLEDWPPPFPGYSLYYSSRRQMPPTLAALIVVLRRSRPNSTDLRVGHRFGGGRQFAARLTLCATIGAFDDALETPSPRDCFVFPTRELACRAVRSEQCNAHRLPRAL